MKALSLWQPWASLVADGLKRFETRSWPTAYRGPLAIHAAKRPMTANEYELIDLWAETGLLSRTWAEAAYKGLPHGAVLAQSVLRDVLPTNITPISFFMDAMGKRELEFGDFSDGRYGWELVGVQKFAAPVPCRGRQGLFEWAQDGPVLIDQARRVSTSVAVEEDGEVVVTIMPRACTRYECQVSGKDNQLVNRNGFMVCPVCGGSYGRPIAS